MENQGKENAVIPSRNVSLLVENIEKGVRDKRYSKECPELHALKEKCCDVNVSTAFCAFQGITHLVKRKILNGSQIMYSLISLLPSIKHYSPFVITIGDVLFFNVEQEINVTGQYDCQYNFTNNCHPFVIVLKHDTEKSWNAIYTYIQLIFQKSKTNEIAFSNKITVLRPFFVYIFCDPTPNTLSYKMELFSLLMEYVEHSEAKILLIQGLRWQKLDVNYCWLILRICRTFLLSPVGENQLILCAMKPFIAYVIKWLVINGHDPLLWIDLLSECFKIESVGAGSVLYILSDIVLETPPLYINELVGLCKQLIYLLSCNKYVAQKLAAVSLMWLIHPSLLDGLLFRSVESILKFVNVKLKNNEWTSVKISDNSYFQLLRNSHSDVKMAVEMTEISDNWENETMLVNWLKQLNSSNNSSIETSLQNFVIGIFLNGKSDEVLDISSEMLMNFSKHNSGLSFHLLCLIFFKLCREDEPKRQLKYLRLLCKIGIVKENVPFIIGIFETLKNDQTKLMFPVVINLYLKLWKADNRIYSFLHKTLFQSTENCWEINVMKTVALKEICRSAPGTYGKSLVSKLSEILNDSDRDPSGIPSAIAIEAVIELCKASVTDITGAWKVLKPKLSHDKRRKVVISLCNLFGEVPLLKNSGTERDSLTADLVPRLWNYIFSNDLEIVRASLKALAKFGTESYGPKLIPDLLKSDLEVPKQVIKQSSELSKNELLDNLEYIPGECWVELIQRVDSKASKDVGDMIQSLIQQELNSLPRRFFCHPEEVPEPVNYNHLPHSSICRALVVHIKNYLSSLAVQAKDLPESVAESLRILSGDYSTCLPVLNWSFLENFFSLRDDCKKYSVTILAKQGSVSKAGMKVFEKYIADNVNNFVYVNDFIYLYDALPFVCNSLTANILRQFLTKTIKTSLADSLVSGTDHFEIVLNNSKVALDSELVPQPRKVLLLSQIQNVVKQIPADHRVMIKYAEFLAEFPEKTVENLISPSYIRKVTSDVIRRFVLIRKMTALRSESTNPLGLFNECIQAVLNLPSENDFLFESIREVLRKTRNFNHGTWLTELMWWIQTSSTDETESNKITLYLLDIFCICTITISGYDCFLFDFKCDSIRKAILRFFPISLHKLLSFQDYSNLSQKVIEWVHGLSKWKGLPHEYTDTFDQCILILRSNKFCLEKNKWLQLFCGPAMKCFIK